MRLVMANMLLVCAIFLLPACSNSSGDGASGDVGDTSASDGGNTENDDVVADTDSAPTSPCTGGDPLRTEPFVIQLEVEVEDASIVDVCVQTGNAGGSWPLWAEITDPEGNTVAPYDMCAEFCGEGIPGCFAAGAALPSFASLADTGSFSLAWDNLLRPTVTHNEHPCVCREPAPAGTYGVRFCVLAQTAVAGCGNLFDAARRGAEIVGSSEVCFDAEFSYPGTGAFTYSTKL
jgi:hypothetical protein